MITATDLRKAFGGLVAVDGVSLDIAAGETFGLLGPNGAGKTTTISMLTGLLRPDSGSVEIAGSADPTRPEVRRLLGVVPQALAVYEALTAEENLLFMGRLFGLRGAALRRRVDEALDLAGLADRRRDLAREFSGGMLRRLNLVASLLHDPQVLLMDEPTVGVDPQSRNLIFESIERLKAAGRTILYTTHYMEEAQRLCDRVAIMDHGRLLALDTVEGLVAAHGGRSLVEARFAQPPAAEAAAALPGRLEGDTLRVETDAPLEAVARIASAGAEIAGLRVERANLEDVFLNLTGRRLRD